MYQFLTIILQIAVGAAAGWITAKIEKGRIVGPLWNVVFGILGAVAGGALIEAIGLVAVTFFAKLLVAVFGAATVLLIVQKLKERF